MTAFPRVEETELRPGVPAVIVETDELIVTFLPEKGADVYTLRYKPKGCVDILFRTPWGPRERGKTLAGTSEMQWMDDYAGGWQLMFPNAGNECIYRGAVQGFHGEASVVAWQKRIQRVDPDMVAVIFNTSLARTPFALERRFTISGSVLKLTETITNNGGEDMEYVWGQHIAFGEPFLSSACRLHVPNRVLRSDPVQGTGQARLTSGYETNWPLATLQSGDTVDFSQVLPKTEKVADMAYLTGMDDGWYVLGNSELGLNVGVGWELSAYPYVWLWQEFGGSFGYPFYGRTYCMGVEPCSTPISDGLCASVEQGYASKLPPGDTRSTELALVVFEGNPEVRRITSQGLVIH